MALHYLADQLTLFQLGKGRLSPPITAGPPNFFHLPASLSECDVIRKNIDVIKIINYG